METHSVPESDPRFPSGRWTGFFLQKIPPPKGQMELLLSFSQGTMTGEGRDFVGQFIVRGQYSLQDGKCYWTKRYLSRHDVFYQGFNEGKGIWGTWEIPPALNAGVALRGGFHIWPEGMVDPSNEELAEALPLPAPENDLVGVG